MNHTVERTINTRNSLATCPLTVLVLTAAALKNAVFWNNTPGSLLVKGNLRKVLILFLKIERPFMLILRRICKDNPV